MHFRREKKNCKSHLRNRIYSRHTILYSSSLAGMMMMKPIVRTILIGKWKDQAGVCEPNVACAIPSAVRSEKFHISCCRYCGTCVKVCVQLFDAYTSTLATNQLACVRVYLVSHTKHLNIFQSSSDYYARCSSHSSVLNKFYCRWPIVQHIFIHIIVFEPMKIRWWWPDQHRPQSKMEQMKQMKQRIMPLCFSSFICISTRIRHIIVYIFFFLYFVERRKKNRFINRYFSGI